MLTWRQLRLWRGRNGAVAVYERVGEADTPFRVWAYDKTRCGRVTNTNADTLEQALNMARTAVGLLGLGDTADKALYNVT